METDLLENMSTISSFQSGKIKNALFVLQKIFPKKTKKEIIEIAITDLSEKYEDNFRTSKEEKKKFEQLCSSIERDFQGKNKNKSFSQEEIDAYCF